MKFIHFADAHLDSPFRGLSFLPSKAFKQIYEAADQSLTRIVDLALNEQVDLVLIAGDTFDSDQPSPRSQIFFANQIKRLTDAEIQVVMIFGNHDHMRADDLLVQKSPYFKLLGPNEKVEKVSFTTKDQFNYDVVGFSYLNNHITEDKMPEFMPKEQNFTFGLMHAQEKTTATSQNVYAPFSIDEVKRLNYDYFALGHIHLRQNLSEDPWIVYPGNIQGRHINELGAKGCYLGTIDEDSKKTQIEFKETAPIVWQSKTLTLDKELNKNELQERILDLLADAEQTTYFSLQITGAQFLTQEENELVQDSDFWQSLAPNLAYDSQLVDVRFKAAEDEIALNNSDRESFNKAKEEVFAPAEFEEIASAWGRKSPLTEQMLQDPAFRQSVKELAEVKLASKLKGIKDAPEED